jgi:hypothetical protein
MYMNARVYVADILDQVHVEATVWFYETSDFAETEAITFTTDVRGEGETTPSEWLKDALVALVETL